MENLSKHNQAVPGINELKYWLARKQFATRVIPQATGLEALKDALAENIHILLKMQKDPNLKLQRVIISCIWLDGFCKSDHKYHVTFLCRWRHKACFLKWDKVEFSAKPSGLSLCLVMWTKLFFMMLFLCVTWPVSPNNVIPIPQYTHL